MALVLEASKPAISAMPVKLCGKIYFDADGETIFWWTLFFLINRIPFVVAMLFECE